MAGNMTVDASQFNQKIEEIKKIVQRRQKDATLDVAQEILRLSSFEVPHDKGLLQASGSAQPEGDGAVVGYNKVYAARLHEHPEYHFQKGRKGKYLEDPIKHNMAVLLEFIKKSFNDIF